MEIYIKETELDSYGKGIGYHCRKAKEVLQEACHAFNSQYDWAREIANKTVNTIKSGNSHFSISHESGQISSIDVTIEKNINGALCSGNFYGLNPDNGTLKIKLSINPNELRYYSEKQLEAELFSVIAHELMHGNIYFQEINSPTVEKDITNETPEYYSTLVEIMRNERISSDKYWFARILYLFFYQETQAIISQGYAEFEMELNTYNRKIRDFKTMESIIRGLDSYSVFSEAITICDKILEFDYMQKKFLDFLKRNNIKLSNKNPFRIVRNMKKKFSLALKKLVANIYYHAIDSLKL